MQFQRDKFIKWNPNWTCYVWDAQNTWSFLTQYDLFTGESDVIVYVCGGGGRRWVEQVVVGRGASVWRPVSVGGVAKSDSAVVHASGRPRREAAQRATRVWRRVVVRIHLFVVVAGSAQSVVVLLLVVVVVVVAVMPVMRKMLKMVMVVMRMLRLLMLVNVVRCHSRVLRSSRLLQPSTN